MCRIKRLLCPLVIFAFMLSGMPAAAHLCLHDMHSGKAETAQTQPAAETPPCHQQAAGQNTAPSKSSKSSGKMDCCGDSCTCVAGTCAGSLALPALHTDSLAAALATADFVPAVAHFRPFTPEQATPPPRA